MVITKVTRKTSNNEELKTSTDDITPQSGVSSGMDFEGSPKKNKRGPLKDKMSAFNLMEGKKYTPIPQPIIEDDESSCGFTESILSVNSRFNQKEDNK